jgi:hypothetical protein
MITICLSALLWLSLTAGAFAAPSNPGHPPLSNPVSPGAAETIPLYMPAGGGVPIAPGGRPRNQRPPPLQQAPAPTHHYAGAAETQSTTALRSR